jgi:two-component system, OmpR family, sensor kinase
MSRFYQSMRWRLQLWYGLILVAVLTAFGVTAYQLERNRQFRAMDDELNRRLSVVIGALRPPGRPGEGPIPRRDRPPPRIEEDAPERRPTGPETFRLPPRHDHLFADDERPFYFIVWRRDGTELARSPNAPADVSKPVNVEPGLPPHNRSRNAWREAIHATPPGESLLVGRNIAPELGALRHTAWWLAGIGASVLLLGLAGGWWIASRAIRPITDISHTATKIADGDLSQRIDAADTDSELGQLANVLNSTFARLEAAFAQQARFTADAAHELRTPVTVMLTQTQSVLTRERGAAEYRSTIEACQRAAQRMRRLIESLLALARLDAGQLPNRARADLADSVREAIELVAPIAAERQVQIVSECEALVCEIDSEQITQVVTNLLTNAMRHSPAGSGVRVTTRLEKDAVVLTVTDQGSGIAAEDLPHIFERFYRADKSRTDGHAGIGLAIVKSIVEAHGGTIEVASPPGAGAAFMVRLPADTSARDR